MTPDSQLARARERVAHAWLQEEPILEVARVVSDLVRCDSPFVYDFDAGGSPCRVGHGLSATGTDWAAFHNYRQVPRYARYGSPADPLANRAVTTGELFRGSRGALERARAGLWRPNACHWQLRVALYDGPRVVGLVAALRCRRSGEFDEEEEARLQALVPELIETFSVAAVLNESPTTVGVLATALDAFDQPAYLVSPRGAPMHANAAARRTFRDVPAYLRAAAREPERARQLARVTPVDVGGKQLLLVVPRVSPPSRAEELPQYLRPIADALARGLADKEIANELHLSLATARTYVSRVLSTLGYSSRRQLMAAAGGDRKPLS